LRKLSRRVELPLFLWTGSWRMHVNIGVQAGNLLDRRNLVGLGSVATIVFSFSKREAS
jgi:hypothetical protein